MISLHNKMNLAVNPLVSTIITTHNRCDLLKQAVNSVLEQTYSNAELLVVDDGSTDGTEEWCQRQSFKYIRIPVGKNKGGNYARNLGIQNARGEFVAFLDDDDYWLPSKLEKQITVLQENNGDLIYTLRKFEIISNKNKRILQESYNPKFVGDVSKEILTVECITNTSTLLIKKSFLESIGGWDEKQEAWQDNELLIRCAQYTKFYCVPEPLVIYRINPNGVQVSHKYYEWKRAAKRIYKKYSAQYSSLNFIGKCKVFRIYIRNSALRSRIAGLKYRSMMFFCLYAFLYPKETLDIVKNKINREI